MLAQIELPVHHEVERLPDGRWKATSRNFPEMEEVAESANEAERRLLAQVETWGMLKLAQAMPRRRRWVEAG